MHRVGGTETQLLGRRVTLAEGPPAWAERGSARLCSEDLRAPLPKATSHGGNGQSPRGTCPPLSPSYAAEEDDEKRPSRGRAKTR